MPDQGEPISVDAARRIALAAQGFAEPRPSGRVGVRQIRQVIDRIGVLQVDSVNVVCRSHYLPVFARLGPYSRDALDQMVWNDGRRELFEYFWGHKAALVPLRSYSLLRWQMRAAARQTGRGGGALAEGMRRLAEQWPGLVDEVLATLTERGPLAAGELAPDGQRRRGPAEEGGRMWNWQDTKIAVEWLFAAGRVTIAARRNFERLYDLTERVIPADVLAQPELDAEDAQRELVRIAARAQGIATAHDLCGPPRGYIHLPREQGKARVAELVEAGELIPVTVEGVRKPVYLWGEMDVAKQPRQVHARALLSPFDSLIWTRERTEWLYDFHYRISIYTPEPQRVHGYYVLPFLLGDRLVARVDVKADRANSTLVVPVVNVEPEHRERKREIASELADELRLMAGWLELERVRVEGRGDLASTLSRAIGR